METHCAVKHFMLSFSIHIVISRFAYYMLRYTLLITLENRQNEKYVSLAEPIFLNIYSYDNIKTDFGPVKSNARYWWKRRVSYVGCDGLPYVTASRLIETDVGKYDWVAMSSSLGHLYMNQQKTLLNIACNILL